MALVAGAVSATGFAPLDLWPITIAAFALWMWLVAEAPDLRAALARGWCFGVGHFTVGMNWIAGSFRYQETMPVWLGGVAVVVLALYLAVYPAMAAGLAHKFRSSRAQSRDGVDKMGVSTTLDTNGIDVAFVLIFSAAWIVTEYLRATLFTGFAWNPLAAAGLHFMWYAQVLGTYGLSGLMILFAGSLMLFVTDRNWRTFGALCAAVAIGFGSWSNLLSLSMPSNMPATPRILVVQPNIGQQTKHDDSFDELNWSKLSSLTGPPGDQPRLILWPEAAVPYFLEEERWAVDRIARLMGPKDMLLTGGDAFVWDKAGKNIVAAHNAVFAVSPAARLTARYDKAHLVPYGEYLPMRPLLSAIGLNRLVPGDLDFWPGPGPRTLNIAGFGKVGVQICYEIIFSGEVVDAKNRPDFIFNPSNDAWFGAWGSPQFVAQSRLRAIEEGLPVIRATPTGISAVIDSNGAVRVALPTGKAGVIQTTLPAPAPPTLFARLGHIMTALCVLTLIGFAVALRRWQR
jgi:apolipoprotein N-acyltransferase